MGQLRALVANDLMGSVGYVSGVSGGSWCATAFTYYIRPGSDDEFLGIPVEPNALTWPGLLGDPAALGQTATTDLGQVIYDLWEAGVPSDQLWLQAIGTVFFQPFGLYDPVDPKYFSLNEQAVRSIAQRNPSLAGATFVLPRSEFSPKVAPRPYLIINSCLIWPTGEFRHENLMGFEYTPLYVGIAKASTLSDAGEQRLVGGGYLEPFAYGSPAPVAPPRPPSGLGGSWTVQVPPPEAVFTLADASGTSSSAFARDFDYIDPNYSPQMPYWPVTKAGGVPALPYDFGDGGSLENYGIIALLLRQVRNIVVFINTSVKLSTVRRFSDKSPPYESEMDDVLPQLFGVPVETDLGQENPYPNDQVFASSDFGRVSDALQDAKNAGRGAVTVSQLTTVANTWWGVHAGIDVQVCWVYLDRVPKWESKLMQQPNPETGNTILDDIERGNQSDPLFPGPVEYFPNYLTVNENDWRIVQLSNYQVNLLADLTCWTVNENINAIRGVLDG